MSDKKMDNYVAAIIDCETTGLDPGKHCVIEVAAVIYDLVRMSILETYSSLIYQADVKAHGNPAEHVNGISPALLAGAPSQEVVWGRLWTTVMDVGVFVAHRASFDRSFFPRTVREARPWACTKFGVWWPAGHYADSLLPLVNSHRAQCGMPETTQRHRALGDCLLIVDLFERARDLGFDVRSAIESGVGIMTAQTEKPNRE